MENVLCMKQVSYLSARLTDSVRKLDPRLAAPVLHFESSLRLLREEFLLIRLEIERRI